MLQITALILYLWPSVDCSFVDVQTLHWNKQLASVYIDVNPSQALHVLDEKYMSICLGPRAITRFDYDFDPRSIKFDILFDKHMSVKYFQVLL